MDAQPAVPSRDYPESLVGAIFDQHKNIRSQLDVMEATSKKMRAGELDTMHLRARMLELSSFLLIHFNLEEMVLEALQKYSSAVPLFSLEDLHRSHVGQRQEAENIAATAMNQGITGEELANLTEKLVEDLRQDMNHEEQWLSSYQRDASRALLESR